MLDESICHFRDVRYSVAFILFLMENPIANNVDPN